MLPPISPKITHPGLVPSQPKFQGQSHFTIEDDADICKIQAITGRKSRGNVVRDALAIYGYLTARRAEGDKLFLGRDLETAPELVVSTLEKAAQRGQKARKAKKK